MVGSHLCRVAALLAVEVPHTGASLLSPTAQVGNPSLSGWQACNLKAAWERERESAMRTFVRKLMIIVKWKRKKNITTKNIFIKRRVCCWWLVAVGWWWWQWLKCKRLFVGGSCCWWLILVWCCLVLLVVLVVVVVGWKCWWCRWLLASGVGCWLVVLSGGGCWQCWWRLTVNCFGSCCTDFKYTAFPWFYLMKLYFCGWLFVSDFVWITHRSLSADNLF